MSEQGREVTEADALEALYERVLVAIREVHDVTSTLRRMTGASVDPWKVGPFRGALLDLRQQVKLAARSADDLRRRAANPRDGGES